MGKFLADATRGGKGRSTREKNTVMDLLKSVGAAGTSAVITVTGQCHYIVALTTLLGCLIDNK